MNKKIKIIDLLNKIANEEEIPQHIEYNENKYFWSKEYKDYRRKTSEISEAYWDCVYFENLNEVVEILEDNTEEIEELESWRLAVDEDDYNTLNYTLDRFGRKIDELVKRINYIERKINDN